MDKIEYIARELCRVDQIDPDALCVDVRIRPWENSMLRKVDTGSLVQPAWAFYAKEVELVLGFETAWLQWKETQK
jgi:hypothetical protein